MRLPWWLGLWRVPLGLVRDARDARRALRALGEHLSASDRGPWV